VDRRRRRVVWSEGARLELEQAIDHIAREHPLSASGVLGRVLGAARSLGTLAERGRTVPEWDDPAVRELLVDPFRLIYKVRRGEVDVLACIHQRRDLRGWKSTDRLREGSPLDVPGVDTDVRREDILQAIRGSREHVGAGPGVHGPDVDEDNSVRGMLEGRPPSRRAEELRPGG